jgi:hypothetical protein
MAKKEKTATELLNVAIAGIESCITVAAAADHDPGTEHALKKAREYCEEARDALITIQFHIRQI